MGIDIRYWAKTIFDSIINGIGYVIVHAAPVAAAFPASVSILRATNYATDAWFIVAGVEAVGYTAGHFALPVYRRGWLSVRQIIAAFAIYGIGIEGMILFYDVVPAFHAWYYQAESFTRFAQSLVALIFPLFTIMGAAIFALIAMLNEAKADETEDKEHQRKIQYRRDEIDLVAYEKETLATADIKVRERETNLRIKEHKAMSDSKGDSKGDSGISKEDSVKKFYASNPKASQRKASSATGVSQGQISKMLNRWESAGIVHRNGGGITFRDDSESAQ